MAIAAVKVMASGKAGLEAMPYFVNEFNGQGYQCLPPLGLDHDEAVISEAVRHTRELVEANSGGGGEKRWAKSVGALNRTAMAGPTSC